MYLYHGMAVYYAKRSRHLVQIYVKFGPPSRRRTTNFEKIYARIRERAAERGGLSVVLLSWAVNVGRDYAQRVVEHQAIPRG
jgi:hypothetical protein